MSGIEYRIEHTIAYHTYICISAYVCVCICRFNVDVICTCMRRTTRHHASKSVNQGPDLTPLPPRKAGVADPKGDTI